MPDIIQLLPDSVANQIAAGEVIQRPASVVKELVENAVDAGATSITVNIKDAGKTLIQIIDNGCGMSETDARMSFERHATSKIKSANDLFAIRTMGFRGEALASIAAIATVELKTKRKEDEVGTAINISGSEVLSQEAVSCSNGTNFLIKNLFFNVPARRKFLKSDATEMSKIIAEFQKIVLANPSISFVLQNNNQEIYNLSAGNLRQRIVSVFGKNINQSLVSIDTETSLIKISGFIGKPEFARKTAGEQYFFVNDRFMKHPYFHKAVLLAYDKILPPDYTPSYFIYLDIDPSTIDINIHPTKTEIKFEDERAIWQILQAAVKESLGKFNIVPSLDFEVEAMLDIPTMSKNTDIEVPTIQINPEYNPFSTQSKPSTQNNNFSSFKKKPVANWDTLYQSFEKESETTSGFMQSLDTFESMMQQKEESVQTDRNIIQLKKKYILSPVKSGLMIIDQKRAHERILYERFMQSIERNDATSQKVLYPISIEFSAAEFALLVEISDDLRLLGFDIDVFGKNSVVVNGIPAKIETPDIKETIETLLEDYKNSQIDIKIKAKEQLAQSLAKISSINYGQPLTNEEMCDLIDNLFACNAPNYTADGKIVISTITSDELEKRFK